MNTKNDGGPAFPVQYSGHRIDAGMSLRDWFAGKVLQGILAHEGATKDLNHYTIRDDAERAYSYADAMLKAREVSP